MRHTHKTAFLFVLLLVSASIWPIGLADAQIPPHEPGTICLTPDFWCWADQQGIPGEFCTCPGSDGPVDGVYG